MSTKAVITMFTAAACVATAGVYGVEVPAIAQPMPPLPLVPSKDCDWQVFATDSDIDQGNGTVVHIQWNNSGRGTASYSSQGHDWQGPVTGTLPLKGTNELDFSVPFSLVAAGFGSGEIAPATNTYSGSIDAGGTASGTWNNNSGASGTWTMGPTFKCIAHAPAAASAPQPQQDSQQAPQQPAETALVTDAIVLLFSPPKPGSITATVSNSSDLTAQCTYDATPFGAHRDFTVGPKTNTSLTFDGLNTLTSYHVVVSCHDASGKQTQEIGHVEKDVTF